MSLLRATWARLVILALVCSCSSTERVPARLDRDAVRERLSADSLWKSLDVITSYRLEATVPYACDNIAAAEEGDGGEAERLRTAGLVELSDSSAILPDSVAHLCTYRATPRLLKLSAEADTSRPELAYDSKPGQSGSRTLRVRTHLAQLDSVTGIQQADGAVEATVEFTVRRVPTEWGRRLIMAEEVVMPTTLRARFDRYDDGWRLRMLR